MVWSLAEWMDRGSKLGLVGEGLEGPFCGDGNVLCLDWGVGLHSYKHFKELIKQYI